MKFLLLFLGLTGLTLAEEPLTNRSASAILHEMLTHRVTKDFSLKGRLTWGRDREADVEILAQNSATETRTIYRLGKAEWLIVQPVLGAPRWFRKGQGELTGDARLEKLGDTEFTIYDLGLPFLRWPGGKVVGDDRLRARDCHVLDVPGLAGEPYHHVKLWVDQDVYALLRAELYGRHEGLERRLSVTSFKRLGEVWIPRGIEVGFVPAHQALPATEKSRLEIIEGSYDAKLPAEWFVEPQ